MEYKGTTIDGILLLDKPANMTSHDCVNRIRKVFNTKKVGHLGTLDPNVTGVLPIAINNATKIIPFLENGTKEYIATISIGCSTDSMDATGVITESNGDHKMITKAEVLNALNSFLGEIEQIPPMTSAIKVSGKRLYEYARKNIEVEIPKRKITIYEIELLSKAEFFTGVEPEFSIRVNCSKGTYIRTLASDIGKKLGYPSHMKKLIRTRSGNFSLSECSSLDEIESKNYQLITPLKALSLYKNVLVSDEDLLFRINNGQKLVNKEDFSDYVIFSDERETILAIYTHDENGLIKPARVFRNNE